MAAMFLVGNILGTVARETHRVPALLQVLGFSGVPLAGIALQMSWRFGRRPARLPGVLAVITLSGVFLHRAPMVAPLAACLAAGIVIAAALSRPWRRPLGSLLAAYLASAVAFIAVVMVVNNVVRGPALPFPANYILIVAAQWIGAARVKPIPA